MKVSCHYSVSSVCLDWSDPKLVLLFQFCKAFRLSCKWSINHGLIVISAKPPGCNVGSISRLMYAVCKGMQRAAYSFDNCKFSRSAHKVIDAWPRISKMCWGSGSSSPMSSLVMAGFLSGLIITGPYRKRIWKWYTTDYYGNVHFRRFRLWSFPFSIL